MRNAKLRDFEVSSRDFLPRWERQQVEQVLCKREFGVDHGRSLRRQPPKAGELRIAQTRRLCQFRLRDANGLELRLQRATVEQRDGDGGLRGEVGLQQSLDGPFNLTALGILTQPAHFLASAGCDRLADVIKRSLRVGARAANKHQRHRRAEKQGFGHRHHFFSSFLGFASWWPCPC